jgi:hypothetical protein
MEHDTLVNTTSTRVIDIIGPTPAETDQALVSKLWPGTCVFQKPDKLRYQTLFTGPCMHESF